MQLLQSRLELVRCKRLSTRSLANSGHRVIQCLSLQMKQVDELFSVAALTETFTGTGRDLKTVEDEDVLVD